MDTDALETLYSLWGNEGVVLDYYDGPLSGFVFENDDIAWFFFNLSDFRRWSEVWLISAISKENIFDYLKRKSDLLTLIKGKNEAYYLLFRKKLKSRSFKVGFDKTKEYLPQPGIIYNYSTFLAFLDFSDIAEQQDIKLVTEFKYNNKGICSLDAKDYLIHDQANESIYIIDEWWLTRLKAKTPTSKFIYKLAVEELENCELLPFEILLTHKERAIRDFAKRVK